MQNQLLADLISEKNSAYSQLYDKYFSMVSRFIVKNSGSIADAEDVFQETLIIFLKKIRSADFQLTASIKTYIMAISKNIWLKKLNNPYKETALNEEHSNNDFDTIDLVILKEQSYWEKLQNYMRQISGHCQNLLSDMFFKNKAIKQIKDEYGYSSIHSAQNQQYKCIEQVKKVKEMEEK